MIVTSTLSVNDLQTDGRRVIIENHTDDSGESYQVVYMADADLAAHLAASAATLNEQLQNSQGGV